MDFKEELFRDRMTEFADGATSAVVLEEVLDRCTFRSKGFANSDTVKGDIPINVLDFITAHLGQPPIFPEPPLVWFPPKFEEVESYCFERCMNDTYTVDFGTFDNEPIQVSIVGFVQRWGDEDFTGKGTMKIDLGLGVKRILTVAVLGRVSCTGTALLLDESLQIYFYKTPHAVDPYLEGMKAQAALVKFPAKGMTKYTELTFVDEYGKVDVEVKDFDDD